MAQVPDFLPDSEFAAAAAALEADFAEAGRPPRDTSVDPLGYGRWLTDFLTARGRGESHVRAIWIMRSGARAGLGLPTLPDPEPSPVPPPIAHRRIEGRLRIMGHGSIDDRGPLNVLGYHLGWGFAQFCRDETEAERQIATIADAGYMLVRSWMTLGWYVAWEGREVAPVDFVDEAGRIVDATPNYFGQATSYLRLLRGYELKFDMSFGDLQMFTDLGDRRDYFRTLGRVIRGEGLQDVVALFEGNELWQNMSRLDPTATLRDEARGMLRTLADELPGTLWGVSCPPNASEEYGDLRAWRENVPLSIVHGYRDASDEATHMIRHSFSLAWEANGQYGLHPMYHTEPGGPGTSVGVLTDPALLGLYAAMNLAVKLGFNYICYPGIWGRAGEGWTSELREQPGFFTVPRLARVLPEDIGQWPGIAHGGSSQAVLVSRDGYYDPAHGVTTGPRRVDQVFDASRCVAIVHGVEGRRVRLASRLPIDRVRMWRGTGELVHDDVALPTEFYEPRLVLLELW